MLRILIVYGTTDGHTQKVAKTLTENFMELGCLVTLVDAKHDGRAYDPALFEAVIIAASVHSGGYQRSIKRWIRRHREAIKAKPNAFISVCLGILQQDSKVQTELNMIMGRFFDQVGWRAMSSLMVAGAIPYTRYNFIKKYLMKRMARKAGGGINTKRDYEYTNWSQLKEFASDFLYVHNLLPKTIDPKIARSFQPQSLN